MSDQTRRFVLMMASAVALAVVVAFLIGGRPAAGTGLAAPSAPVSGGQAYVYRFDPAGASFSFTLTLPTGGADPTDVTVVQNAGHQEVWFTESGIDRIGRLIYTDTVRYNLKEYTLPAGSRPLNLVWGGGFIWFTEAGTNHIARLNPATEITDTFNVPTANSYPADLDRAADGSIWFTEMAANQIGRLVVTSTADYSVTEYTAPTLAGGKPYGIVAVGSGVYFAQTANGKVTRFTPADNKWIDIRLCTIECIPKEPYKLAVNSLGKVWGTERAGNRVSQYTYGTFPVIDAHGVTPTESSPAGIAVDARDGIWFTQQNAGRIGRLDPSSSPVTITYYTLPQPHVSPSGIAVDSQGGVWVVARSILSVDIGFRPDPNGYRFPNYGGLYPLPPAIDDYTRADMRRMFGDAAVCNMVGPVCIVKWAALRWNREVNQAMNGGHGYGMAVTSLRFFKGLDNPSGFQTGASTTHDLLRDSARRNIAYYFVDQAADPAKSYISQMRQNAPSVILDQLRLSMLGGAPDPMTLVIWQAGQGGHAVTPYAIQDQGNGILWVKVYDNNHPDDANRYVVINTNDETWSYDLGRTTWSGRAVSHTLAIVPLSQNPEHPVCPWCKSGVSLNASSTSPSGEIWLAGQGHLLITDSQGRRIGHVGDQFVNEVPGAYESTLIGGLGIQMEPVYNLPLTNTYTILVDGQTLTQRSVVAVTQFGPGYAVSADDVTLNPTSQDRLIIAPDGAQLGYHSSETKVTTLTLAMDGLSSSNQFQIKNASVGTNQAVTLTNKAISGTLKFDNSHASGGKYDLEMNFTNTAGEQRFVHAGIVISATDTHYVGYGSWSGAGGITLQVDHGSNGTIDETLVLSNQAWQVYLPMVIRSQ